MSFSSTMTELADACRKRFGVTSKLSLDDMIKLITPPVFPSGTEILGRTKVSSTEDKQIDIPLTLEAVPPVMSKPIKLLITVSSSYYLRLTSSKLIFNKSDGTQLSLAIPKINTDFTSEGHLVKTVSVTIPANTSIANNKAILIIGEYNSFEMIEKIIATY